MKPFSLILVAVLFSCSGIGDFDIEEETGEVQVDGQPALVPIDLPVNVIPDLALDFDLEQSLAEHDADGASAVRLKALRLETTDTARDGADDEDPLDFIKSVEFFISADGLEEKRIAFLDPVPEGKEILNIETDQSVDLKPYAEKGIKITSKGKGVTPEDDVTLKGIVTLTIEVF